MIQRKLFFWKYSLFLVLSGTVAMSLLLFDKPSVQEGRELFVVSTAPFLALDQKTFENSNTFQQATMLTAPALALKRVLRRFSVPLKGLAVTPEALLVTDGTRLIRIDFMRGGDQIFDYQDEIKHPLVALSIDPEDETFLYAISVEREVYRFNLRFKKPILTKMGIITSLPQDYSIQSMWPHLASKTLCISTTKGNDSLLVHFKPNNWKISQQEFIVPNTIIQTGFYISQNILVVLTQTYDLFVIDADQHSFIGHYQPNPAYKFSDIYNTTPVGVVATPQALYISDSYHQLLEIGWNANPYAIVMNRDIEIKNNQALISWKMPKANPKALYFAELSLKPRTIASGPVENNVLSLPLGAFAGEKKAEIKLMAIHKQNGRLITPASSFILRTPEEKK